MLGVIWMTNILRTQTLSLTDLNIAKPVLLISGNNFGAGSSREHAAWALADYGFKVVIAGSFGDIHYNNELNNGMLPIVQPREVREKLAQLQPSDQVTVDLKQQKIITPVENSLSKSIVNGNTKLLKVVWMISELPCSMKI